MMYALTGADYDVIDGDSSKMTFNEITDAFANPWDTGKPYTMTWDQFANLGISHIMLSDLTTMDNPTMLAEYKETRPKYANYDVINNRPI